MIDDEERENEESAMDEELSAVAHAPSAVHVSPMKSEPKEVKAVNFDWKIIGNLFYH